MSNTNTARSLELLRVLGYESQVVERFIKRAGQPHGIRRDLFGLADIEAMADDHTLYVQTCSAGGLRDHQAKCLSAELPLRIIRGKQYPAGPSNAVKLARLIGCAARRFEIWSWRQRKERAPWELTRSRAVLVEGVPVFLVLAAKPVQENSVKTPALAGEEFA